MRYTPAPGSSAGVVGHGTARCQSITHPLYSCHPSESSGMAMYKKNSPLPANDDRKFARRNTQIHEHSAPWWYAVQKLTKLAARHVQNCQRPKPAAFAYHDGNSDHRQEKSLKHHEGIDGDASPAADSRPRRIQTAVGRQGVSPAMVGETRAGGGEHAQDPTEDHEDAAEHRQRTHDRCH